MEQSDTRFNLAVGGLLVQASFTAFSPTEVLHYIGHEHRCTVDSRLDERSIQELAGGGDKGAAGEIFLIARPFAHEHHARLGRPPAPHAMRCPLPSRASLATPPPNPPLLLRPDR